MSPRPQIVQGLEAEAGIGRLELRLSLIHI